MKRHVVVVDIVVMAATCCLLVAAVLLNFEKYLFRFSFVTLLAFYFIGKYARDYELRLWEKRHIDPSDPSREKRDA